MSAYLLPDGTGIDLGTPVVFERELKRRSQRRMDGSLGSQEWKVWLSEKRPLTMGIVVGVRTLVDGVNEYSGYDEPIVFHPRMRHRAVLVAFQLARRPVLVPFDNVRTCSLDAAGEQAVAENREPQDLALDLGEWAAS